MVIPFTKAHGAKNDFLLTWASQAPREHLAEIAVAICDRHTGIGADGWYIVHPPDEEADASVKLYNSDGSVPEVSGNGTRCVAACLIASGYATREVAIVTGAGLKHLHLIERLDNQFTFEMNMGRPMVDPERLVTELPLVQGSIEVTLVDVGNPQCVVFVEELPENWRELGAELERHPAFPNRSNVSFVRHINRNTIEAFFFERGAGETMSSGTGSTGAAAAALARGLVSSPVTVLTPAGPLVLEWREADAYLTGPAEIVASGEFYLNQ